MAETLGLVEHRKVARVKHALDVRVGDTLDQHVGLSGMDNVIAFAKDAQGWRADLAHSRTEVGAMQIFDTAEKGLGAGARDVAKDHLSDAGRVSGHSERGRGE